jgi:hypothetical protein
MSNNVVFYLFGWAGEVFLMLGQKGNCAQFFSTRELWASAFLAVVADSATALE